MWLNNKQITATKIASYRASLLNNCPNYVVIDNLFNAASLDEVVRVIQQPEYWQTQRHTYSALYVDNRQWQNTRDDQRFVQRDVWQRKAVRTDKDASKSVHLSIADKFLLFLRSDEFMSVISQIVQVPLTDVNVADPNINTNFFRLGPADFVEQHADDSPGREVCMLLYLNKEWRKNSGGELVFMGKNDEPVNIAPLYNRCILFDPSSQGSEHWVNKLNLEYYDQHRYNITSWYWSE